MSHSPVETRTTAHKRNPARERQARALKLEMEQRVGKTILMPRHFSVSAKKKEGMSSRLDDGWLTLCKLAKPKLVLRR